MTGCNAEMRNDLADYAGIGQQPSGLCLASLWGPHSTDNFWTTTLVSLRYLLGLTLPHSIVSRIPLVSSTSALSPKSQARGHFSLPTSLPWFPLFLPFNFLDLFFILFPSPTVTNLLFCPDLMTMFPCNALMCSYDTLWLLMLCTLLIEQISVVWNGLWMDSEPLPSCFSSLSAQVQSSFLIFLTCTLSPLHARQPVTHHIKPLYSFHACQQIISRHEQGAILQQLEWQLRLLLSQTPSS